jgi:hypothetical protein
MSRATTRGVPKGTSATTTGGAQQIKPTIAFVCHALQWHGIHEISAEAIRRAKKNDHDIHVVYTDHQSGCCCSTSIMW